MEGPSATISNVLLTFVYYSIHYSGNALTGIRTVFAKRYPIVPEAIMILEHADFGRIETRMDGSRLTVKFRLKQEVRFGYSAYSTQASSGTLYQNLPASESEQEADFMINMTKVAPSGEAVMLRCVMLDGKGKRQLAQGEEPIQRAETSVRQDAAAAAFWDRADQRNLPGGDR